MMYSFSRLRAVPVATAAVMLLVTLPHALAQTNYGAVRGQVKDASGAHIKDATVILTNLDTKVERTTHTTEAGDYLFSAVDPGNYKVTVSDAGFKNFETGNIGVELGATSTIDAAMQVGGAGETVEVTSSVPMLDTASASGGQVFNEQQLTDLPNLGRNPFVFDKLDNNVTPVGDPRFVRAEDQSGTSSVSVAGAPIGANNYIVDGIPISTSSGGVTFIPSLEAVSDAKVQANTYDAEVGRTGGGAFNASLKSGTAQYHGVLYGETRQTGWAANVWFNPTNKPTASDETYLYAGAFGGPLPFMKKVKYLDNTFFWVTEEGYRQAQPYTSSTTSYYVPTAAERAGDFSADGITLYDPTHTATGGNRCPLTSNGDCATGTANKLPASYINAIGKSILNAYPNPTQAGAFSAGPNYYNVDIFKTRSDMYSGKLEHTFAPWYTATASYVHLATQEPNGNILHVFAENDGVIHRFNDATAVNNTFTLNPTTLLTVGFGFNRYYSNTLQYSTGFNAANGFDGAGFTSGFANQMQSLSYPSITISGVTNSSNLGAANGGPSIQYSRNLVAGINKTIGRHNIKFGYVWRSIDSFSQPASGGNGSFTFNGQYSTQKGTAASGSIAAYADLLMGIPSSAGLTITSGTFNQVAHYNALYAQDDFRLNSKLTVNLGVRYEYELGQTESNNRYNVGFDPNIAYTYPGASGNTVSATGGLRFAGVNGAPVHCCNQQHAKFSPRIGLAYQAMPNTVFHAGYGMFYAPVGLTIANTGYSQASSYSPGTGVSVATAGAGAYLTSPFSNGAALLQPSGNTLGPLTGLGGTLSNLQDFGRRYPLVEQYSLDVQQQLPYGTTLKIGYVGAHSRNIANSVNINQLSDAVMAKYIGGSTNLGTANQKNPYQAGTISGLPATGVTANANVGLGQLLLPFPQFGSITVQQSNGYSNYNSLAIKVQKRVTHGLTLLGTYTWSSNWDNLYSASSSLNSNSGPQDIYNPKAEYARAVNNLPNRFTTAVTYELPFGRGKMLFSHANRFVDEFINGWKINDEWVIQNGGPLAVTQTNLSTTYGVTGVGGTSQRPNLIGDAHSACYSGSPQGRIGRSNGLVLQPYINAAAFSPSQPYTYGNAPRTLPCQGPGYNNSDISINKMFTAGEKLKLEFRLEMLNAMNTPQFGTPSTTLVLNTGGASSAGGAVAYAPGTSNQTLGNLTSQLGFPRIIQMGGRISF